VRAKHAEDTLAATKKEAHDKVVARKEQARAAATAAAEKVNRDIQSAKDTATRSWSAVRAKISSDINHLKADVAQKKHDLDVKMAEKNADELEWEANVAIDYAIASVRRQSGLPWMPSPLAPRLSKLRRHDFTLNKRSPPSERVPNKNVRTLFERPSTRRASQLKAIALI
jgi:hypothetical protein